MDDVKLMRCPFCGNSMVELKHDGNQYYQSDLYYVRCIACKATQGNYSREKAIELWNMRATMSESESFRKGYEEGVLDASEEMMQVCLKMKQTSDS